MKNLNIIKNVQIIRGLFMLVMAVILSTASIMSLTIDLKVEAATTQNLYIFKENVGGNDLYSQTIDGKEVANFSMYDNRDGSFCSISTLRKPDKSEIRYYVEKNNLGKNMINYFTKTGINKGATKINWQGDRVFIEGNKDGYVSKLSSGKFNSAATTYVLKPLTDVKAIDKKILDVCNTADGINKVNKLFKDEKCFFFACKVVDKPKPPISSNLTYLSTTSVDKPDYQNYSVIDKTSGQFCKSSYDPLSRRLEHNYGQNISIIKGKLPLDVINNYSETSLRFNYFKNKDTKFFNSKSSSDSNIVYLTYNSVNTSYTNGTSTIVNELQRDGIEGFEIPLNDIPAVSQSMLSDCMKTNGIQNAVDTYKTRFKDEKLSFSNFSSNLTYLSTTSVDKPDYQNYSVIDKTSGQFCKSSYDPLSRRLEHNYGQNISIIKGKLPLDVINNYSETSLRFNYFKNKDTKFFNSKSSSDSNIVYLTYNSVNTSYTNGTSTIVNELQRDGIEGFEIPLNDIPAVSQSMLSDCMKTNGIQNAVDTYKTRFR